MSLRSRLAKFGLTNTPSEQSTSAPQSAHETLNEDSLTSKSHEPSALSESAGAEGNADIFATEAEAEAVGEFLTPHETRHRTIVLKELYQIMDLSRINTLGETEARAQIAEFSHAIIAREQMPLSAESRKSVIEQIQAEILGLGPLEVLLKDPTISDIMVNGPHCIYVERNGKLHRSAVVFDDNPHLMRIIDRIVSSVGRRIDESVPMVDARLKDGSRVNVIIPPLALDGAVVSIRRFPAQPLTMQGLTERGALSRTMARFLVAAVRGRKNIIISGGTGSGKTTTLNALSSFIPNSERIITIEDAAELQLQQTHIVRLETRPSNIEGRGEVSQRDLVKNALRMRPDRIVIGEVRGQEAIDMLQAMNTGHDGSLTTVHANTARDALGRIENMVAMAGFELPIRAVRNQIASAVDLVIQVQRLEDGSRRMISISEVVGMEGDIITMSDLFVFKRLGLDPQGKVIGQFKSTGAVPQFLDDLRRRGMDISLDMFDEASAKSDNLT